MDLTLEFFGVAPNRGDETHYFFKEPSAFLAKLGDDLLFTINKPTTYRFESGGLVADLSGDGYKGLIPSTACYMVAYSADYSFWKCYYVNSCDFHGGLWYFSLTPDYWGTYVKDAGFLDVHAERLNRNPGCVGTYDEPAQVENAGVVKRLGSKLTKEDMVLVVFASVNLVSETDKVNNTGFLLYIDIKDVETTGASVGKPDVKQNIVECCSGFAAGITEVKGFNEWNRPASIAKAWLLPSDWVSFDRGGMVTYDYTLASINPAELAAQGTFHTLGAGVKTIDYDLTDVYGNALKDVYPNGRLLVGTKGHLVEIKRLTKPGFTIKCLTTFSGIQVILSDGVSETDITDGFEVPLYAEATELSMLQKMSKYGGYIGNSLLGVVKGYMKSGAVGASLSATSSAIGALGLLAPMEGKEVGQVDVGDAFATYAPDDPVADMPETYEKLPFPLVAVTYKSRGQEDINAYFAGAQVDWWQQGAAGLSAFKAMASGDFYVPDPQGDETYFRGTAVVCYAPRNAVDYMEAELRRGVYYVYAGK